MIDFRYTLLKIPFRFIIVQGYVDLAVEAATPSLLAMKLAPSALILAGMQVMFVGGGVILLALGLVIHATGRLVKKSE